MKMKHKLKIQCRGNSNTKRVPLYWPTLPYSNPAMDSSLKLRSLFFRTRTLLLLLHIPDWGSVLHDLHGSVVVISVFWLFSRRNFNRQNWWLISNILLRCCFAPHAWIVNTEFYEHSALRSRNVKISWREANLLQSQLLSYKHSFILLRPMAPSKVIPNPHRLCGMTDWHPAELTGISDVQV